MPRKGSGFVDAAYQILKETSHPMHAEEIARASLDRGLAISHAEDPIHSLVGTLYSEVERRPNTRGFTSLGGGLFGLAEWGELTTSAPAAPVRRRRTSTRIEQAPSLGISLEKLERIRQVMPAQQFEEDWGELYQRLKAEERARQITSVTDRQLAERTRGVVAIIHAFLRGTSDDAPKSEQICDWIFICYTLELYREGAALWHFVNRDEVDAAKYERTEKYSTACRARVS